MILFFSLSSEKRENPPPLQRKVIVVKGSRQCLSILKLSYALASSDFESRRVQCFLRSVKPPITVASITGSTTYDHPKRVVFWTGICLWATGPRPLALAGWSFDLPTDGVCWLESWLIGWAENANPVDTESPAESLLFKLESFELGGDAKRASSRSLFSSKFECKSIISGQASKITSALRRAVERRGVIRSVPSGRCHVPPEVAARPASRSNC
jgi:hypothetical protein